jgi:hypothetical protein
MGAAKQIAGKVTANRWFNQVSGVVLVGMGIVALTKPAPQISLRCLETAAVHRLAPVVSKTEVGRQVLAMYCGSDTSCRRTL